MSRLGTTKAGQSLSSGILTPTVAARVMRGGVLRGGSGTRASSETGEWAYTLNLDNLKTQDLFMSTHNEEDLYLASTHIELTRRTRRTHVLAGLLMDLHRGATSMCSILV